MESHRTIRFAVASPFPESDESPKAAASPLDAKIDRLIESLEQLNKVLGTVRPPKAERTIQAKADTAIDVGPPIESVETRLAASPSEPMGSRDHFGPLVSEIEQSLSRYQHRPAPILELTEPSHPLIAEPQAFEVLDAQRPPEAEKGGAFEGSADAPSSVANETEAVDIEAPLDDRLAHLNDLPLPSSPAEVPHEVIADAVSADEVIATAAKPVVEMRMPRRKDVSAVARMSSARLKSDIDLHLISNKGSFDVKPLRDTGGRPRADTAHAAPRLAARIASPINELTIPLRRPATRRAVPVKPTAAVNRTPSILARAPSDRRPARWTRSALVAALALVAVVALPGKGLFEPTRTRAIAGRATSGSVNVRQQVAQPLTIANNVIDVVDKTSDETQTTRPIPPPELSPYRFPMLDRLLSGPEKAEPLAGDLLDAIVRMEGMYDPTRLGPLGPSLRMQIRPGTASMTNVFGDRWLRTHIDPNVHYKVGTYALVWLDPPAPDCANFVKIHALENVLTLDMMTPSDCAAIRALSAQTRDTITYQSISAAPMSMPLFSAPYPGGRFTHEQLQVVLETRAAVAQQLLWFKRGAQ